MSDRIIIDFENEEEKPGNGEERIVIDFDSEEKRIEIEDFEKSYEEQISKSRIDFYFRGNPLLNNSYETELKFPEGIDKGFRRMFSTDCGDGFFNSILVNNRHIILASRKGNVFLVDRHRGKIRNKIFFNDEVFEKTGIVHENVIYINSLKKIFRIDDSNIENPKQVTLYSAPQDYLIWSNLNRCGRHLLFTEFNAVSRKCRLKIIDMNSIESVSEFEFEAVKFSFDRICVAGRLVFVMFDSSFLVYDLESMNGAIHPLNVEIDENSFVFYLNHKLYITSRQNEIYYLDLPAVDFAFRYSGIRNSYINSMGGFADNIFTGTLDGWKSYKASGLKVYESEDEYENRVECVSKNVIVLSQKNKIVFCNLNRFQEAEGYVISSRKRDDSEEIISAVFSGMDIFVLTESGLLEAFRNDKLNIHI